MIASLIVGLSGHAMTGEERRFYRDVQPAGTILFSRNVADREQLKRLVSEVRDAVGRDDFLVLIDQEGGRVQRLKPPVARLLPPAAAYAEFYGSDPEAAKHAAFAVARLTGEELREFGITMNCAPVVDLPVEGAHEIISDRAYGTTPGQVVALARAVAEGYLAGGVVPVIKHIPGHGRATADSHFALPVVATTREMLSATDFAPFKALADLPAAMTAHVVYSAIDGAYPASTSVLVTREIIHGEIGFDNLLMSDDLSMKALSGPMRTRAEAVIAAGSDLALHCNGDMDEMRAAAEGVPALSGRAAERFALACSCIGPIEAYDREEALQLLAGLLGQQTPVV
ncbi:beta-N-acetylhexosaminidase [Hyphomicrobium sp.]|uniref:beta-N-acetylhexosaminidase n=1 Tax=Hyphomicrobium sp. TaxID=82 RepID=UPI002D771787|nr:beta-N-acetylhexosaminidase [Hyphomicrobium sp.]HET6389053.1 beta-N-acetylhexosaminidase [Hyphomicrobium sp.]